MFWEPSQCSVISGTLIKAGQTGGVSAGLEFPGKFLLKQRISQCSRFTYGSLRWGWSQMLPRASELPLMRTNVKWSPLSACDNQVQSLYLPSSLAAKRMQVLSSSSARSRNVYCLTIWRFNNWVDWRQMLLKHCPLYYFIIICSLCLCVFRFFIMNYINIFKSLFYIVLSLIIK